MLSSFKQPLLATLVALALVAPGATALAAPGGARTPASAVVAPDGPDAVININEATPDQLSYLPGIGPAKAERIVAYRAKHPFKTALELARVRGIGLKTVHKLQQWLRASGPTTLSGPVRTPKHPPETEAQR